MTNGRYFNRQFSSGRPEVAINQNRTPGLQSSSRLLTIMLQDRSERKLRAGRGQFFITNAGVACSRFVCRLQLGAIFAGGLFVTSIGEVRSQPSELPGPGPERKTSVIGYGSVEEAMRALKEKPGSSVTVTKPDSWIIINEPGPLSTQWSFTPAGHYAHPAVVRRAIKIVDNGDVSIETTALCEAQKVSCDKLIGEFRQLNERARQSVQKRLQDPASR
ncbi:hypothetical protein ACSFA7_19245 [Variovorax sp. LT1R20]|uniref:hypothetical protein n=1 Tax=Variovorax sp. LT1R20 TaxID=3443729 RepID=UPI003F45C978